MWKLVSTGAALAALGGCATIPATMQVEPVAQAQIIRAVQCELGSIYRWPDVSPDLLMYSSSLTKLDLMTTDNSGAEPGLGFEHKWDDNSVELHPGASFAQKAERTNTVQFLNDFSAFSSSKLAAECPAPGSAGELGLADWLHQVLISNQAGTASFIDLTFVAEFTVTRGVGGGLVFKSSFGSLNFDKSTVSRERKNHIEVTIKVLAKPDTKRGVPAVVKSVPLIDELRSLQEPEDKGTTITVEKGQTIIVQ